METIRVLIADDHPLVLHGIREILRVEDDIALVGEASRGDEAQRLCRELQPDVLLLDLQMPGATAVETVAHVHTESPTTRVIILTAYDDAVYVRRIIAEGAVGYVLKDEVMEAVITAIRSVIQGGTWLSHRVLDTLIAQSLPLEDAENLCASSNEPLGGISTAAANPLTRRHRDVLGLVQQGLTNEEIAAQLCVSPGTVKKHLDDIYARLGVHNRMMAARVARESKYLD